MLFNSISFLIFFPIVFLAYYAIPHRFRVFFLLLASCYFYMAFVPKYVLILFFLITTDYFLAFLIQNETWPRRKLFLSISILANIGILFFFKYFNFFNENVASIAQFLHWNYSPVIISIALPLGLSFHVFQSLGYVIEVYKGKYQPEKNYITYALYVMYFPQLVAGPIERPQHLLPQLSQNHDFDGVKARRGLERILWGLFKKLVIADQIAQVINPLYSTMPTDGSVLMAMSILFSYQLYCDFSGYSDIAIGTSLMLGYDLTENFNRPFAARSLADFWRRWHISLSNWLRDYLYYPLALGFGKVSKIKLYCSLFITFVLIGLWHGANWTFVVFGAIHGAYLVIELLTEKKRKWIVRKIGLSKKQTLHNVVQTVCVFALVTISFVFFRAESVGQAWWIVTHMFVDIHVDFIRHGLIGVLTSVVGKIVFMFIVAAIIVMEIVQYFQEKKNTLYIFDMLPKPLRYGWYYFLIFSIAMFGYFGAQAFIYFQF